MGLTTKFRTEDLRCPKCKGEIKFAIVENRGLGSREPLTRHDALTMSLLDAKRDIDNMCEVVDNMFKRSKNIDHRYRKLKNILHDWAMMNADATLLDILDKVDHGDFDKDE